MAPRSSKPEAEVRVTRPPTATNRAPRSVAMTCNGELTGSSFAMRALRLEVLVEVVK